MPPDQNTIPAESENIQADKQNSIPDEKSISSNTPEPSEPAFQDTKISEHVQDSEPSTENQDIQADKLTAQIPVFEPLPVSTPTKPSQKDLWQRFLEKVSFNKRKKLDKIMTLFSENQESHSKGRIVRHDIAISNDEVEKFLHVSDATATRYLAQLEKEGKISPNSKIGKYVSYSKI